MVLEDLARAQFESGQFGQAYQTLQTLQGLGIENRPDLMHMEARCLTLNGRMTEARSVYLELTRQSPSNADVWAELGNVALEVGDYRRVALASSRVMSLAPERYEGPMLKGLYEQHRGNLNGAIENLHHATQLAPEATWPRLLLGLAYEDQGSINQAAACYKTVLDSDPDNEQARRLYDMVAESSTH